MEQSTIFNVDYNELKEKSSVKSITLPFEFLTKTCTYNPATSKQFECTLNVQLNSNEMSIQLEIHSHDVHWDYTGVTRIIPLVQLKKKMVIYLLKDIIEGRWSIKNLGLYELKQIPKYLFILHISNLPK